MPKQLLSPKLWPMPDLGLGRLSPMADYLDCPYLAIHLGDPLVPLTRDQIWHLMIELIEILPCGHPSIALCSATYSQANADPDLLGIPVKVALGIGFAPIPKVKKKYFGHR
jgi:hypothetical protein